MRSRYSAYVLRNGAYLHRSWHGSTRPNKKGLMQLPPTAWLGLEIVRTAGRELDTAGIVNSSPATGMGSKPAGCMKPAGFVKEGGRWYYVAGIKGVFTEQ